MAWSRWLLAFASACALAAACGGESEGADPASGSAGTATGGSSASGGSAAGGGSGGAAATGGFAVIDAATDPATDPGILPEAGWFDCAVCLCPGDTHYCLLVSAGMLSPPDPPDGALCSAADAGTTHCTPLPSDCNGVPACGCLLTMPACTCEDVGGGLQVHCAYP